MEKMNNTNTEKFKDYQKFLDDPPKFAFKRRTNVNKIVNRNSKQKIMTKNEENLVTADISMDNKCDTFENQNRISTRDTDNRQNDVIKIPHNNDVLEEK